MKLSVSLSGVLLRHITVAFLMNMLDAVTCSVEVKFASREVPLTLMREAVNEPRLKFRGGLSLVVYKICSVMSGLRHSRELDTNTRQVNITRSPGHVNCLVLSDVSSTFPTKSEE